MSGNLIFLKPDLTCGSEQVGLTLICIAAGPVPFGLTLIVSGSVRGLTLADWLRPDFLKESRIFFQMENTIILKIY